MSGDYLWDRSGPRDPEVVRLERLLEPLGQKDPPPPLRMRPARRLRASWPVLAALVAAAAVVVLGTVWWIRATPGHGLEVTRAAGAPTIGSRPIVDRLQLPVGRWLETDARGRATIDVATIGRVDVDPGTRVSLLSTRPGDYRLHLARGTVHAQIWAPPGQFFVETSSSTAIDLGCAYTLTVDDDGVGLVRVTLGWVGFEWHGREAFIPAGAVCTTRRDRGPGTPHYEDASPALLEALDTIDAIAPDAADRQAETVALDRVLGEARPRDAVTLWHLLTRVDGDLRGRVFDRLAEFVPPPVGVTREGVLAGRREMLDAWWDHLGFGTATWWRTWKQQWR